MSAPIPIAQLEPGAHTSAHIQGVVTLIWPYSSSKKVFSLLLVDPDFRLRRNKGQVRLIFKGACAKSLAKARIVSGDELQVNLAGCKWLQEDPASTTVRTPGTTVGWELLFGTQLHLLVLQAGGVASRTIDVDAEPGTNEDVPSDGFSLPHTPVQPRFASSPPESIGSVGSWSTPAFLKKRTLEQALAPSSYDVFADESVLADERPAPKRFKFGRGSQQWRFVDEDAEDGERQPDSTEVVSLEVVDAVNGSEDLREGPATDRLDRDPAQGDRNQHEFQELDHLSDDSETVVQASQARSSNNVGLSVDANVAATDKDHGRTKTTITGTSLNGANGANGVGLPHNIYDFTQDHDLPASQDQLADGTSADDLQMLDQMLETEPVAVADTALEMHHTSAMMLPHGGPTATSDVNVFAGNNQNHFSSILDADRALEGIDPAVRDALAVSSSEPNIDYQPMANFQQSKAEGNNEDQASNTLDDVDHVLEGIDPAVRAAVHASVGETNIDTQAMVGHQPNEEEDGEVDHSNEDRVSKPPEGNDRVLERVHPALRAAPEISTNELDINTQPMVDLQQDEDEESDEEETEVDDQAKFNREELQAEHDEEEDEEIRDYEDEDEDVESSENEFDDPTGTGVHRDDAHQALPYQPVASDAAGTGPPPKMLESAKAEVTEVIELSSEDEASDIDEAELSHHADALRHGTQDDHRAMAEGVDEEEELYSEDEESDGEEDDEEGVDEGESDGGEVDHDADYGDEDVKAPDGDMEDAVEQVDEDGDTLTAGQTQQSHSTQNSASKDSTGTSDLFGKFGTAQAETMTGYSSALDTQHEYMSANEQAVDVSLFSIDQASRVDGRSHEEHPASMEYDPSQTQQAQPQPHAVDERSVEAIEEVSLIPETEHATKIHPSEDIDEEEERLEHEESRDVYQGSPIVSHDLATSKADPASMDIETVEEKKVPGTQTPHEDDSDGITSVHSVEQSETAIGMPQTDKPVHKPRNAREPPSPKDTTLSSQPVLRRSTRRVKHQSIDADDIAHDNKFDNQRDSPEQLRQQPDTSAAASFAETVTTVEFDADPPASAEKMEVDVPSRPREEESPPRRSTRRLGKSRKQGDASAELAVLSAKTPVQFDGTNSAASSVTTRARPRRTRTPVGDTPADNSQVGNAGERAQSPDQVSQQLLQEAQTARDQEDLLPPISRGLRTKHAYLSPLSNLSQHHRQAVDAMSLIVGTTKPERAQTGPRDWHLTIYVTDGSMQDATQSLRTVQIFRPAKSALPLGASADDVILLHQFRCETQKRKPMLISTASSGWAVFDDEGTVKSNGPPVEYDDEEVGLSQQLCSWWNRVPGDKKMRMRTDFTQARDAAKEAARRKSGRKSIIKPGAMAHELRDGTVYPYTDTPLVSDE